MFQRIPVYIRVYPNQVEVVNLKTGDKVLKTAVQPFSNSRLVIAHFDAATATVMEALKEARLTKRSIKVLMQQMVVFEEELTIVEKRVLRDLAEQAGAAAVYLITKAEPLSDAEALEVFGMKFE